MTSWIVSLLVGVLLLLPLPGGPSTPPAGPETGEVVGAWTGIYSRHLTGPALIRDENEWQEFLESSFPNDVVPPLEGGPGPDFTNAVAVVKDSAVCSGEVRLRHRGSGELEFTVEDVEDDIECHMHPEHTVWQVDLDELGVTRERVTLIGSR